MKYNEIQTSKDDTYFIYNGKPLFERKFKHILKFHAEGFAPVCDSAGWYHINLQGTAIYPERYTKAFGYYFGRAVVVQAHEWFHIDTTGTRVYPDSFVWCGNYQENVCTVRDTDQLYSHIDTAGREIYAEKYKYAGDYKDGFAVVKLANGLCKHIDKQGYALNGKLFADLGVFHKSFATAKDAKGWFHIDKNGAEIYTSRYLAIEPFYNGFALVETFGGTKQIIDEAGNAILSLP